ADPDDDLAAVLVGEQRDGVDAAGVDVAEVLGDQLLEPAGTGDVLVTGTVGAAEVERGQEVDGGVVSAGDLVQLVLHGGGEVVVDQAGVVPLHQPDHREGQEGRDHRLAAL